MLPILTKAKLDYIHNNLVDKYELLSPLTSKHVREFYVVAFEHLLLLSLQERLERITDLDYEYWNEIRLSYKSGRLSHAGLEKIKDIKKEIKRDSKDIVSYIMKDRSAIYFKENSAYGPLSSGKQFFKFGREVLKDTSNSGIYIRSKFPLSRSIEEMLDHNDNLHHYRQEIKSTIDCISIGIDFDVFRDSQSSRLLGFETGKACIVA